MTDQAEGRDDSPAVAALAIELSRARCEIDSLTSKLDRLTADHRRHSTVLSDLAKIRQQIQQILTLLNTENEASPARWFWLTMADDEREAKFSELYDWVETILRQQYPDYLADQIRLCWPNHPEARWELTWLYQLWTLTYLTTRPMPRDAGDWHDRWTPGVIRRLSHVMAHCGSECRTN
jgi:hypothetical protein